MISKKLMGFWIFFDVCLLVAGIMTLVLSIVWREPNLLLNLTFDKFELNGAFSSSSSSSCTHAPSSW